MLKTFTRNKAYIAIFAVLFALLAFSTDASAAAATLRLRAPSGLQISTDFDLDLCLGAGTTELGIHAAKDDSQSTATEWVWKINTPGVYNYRTTTKSTTVGQRVYNISKLILITEQYVNNNVNLAFQIETGIVGSAYDYFTSTGALVVPNYELIQMNGPLSAPSGSTVYNTPMFTKPGYGRFQFSKQEDILEFVQNIVTASPKAHLFMLGNNIDPVTGTPFGKTLSLGYDIPIVIVTNSNIPAGSTFDQAAKIIRENGKPTFFHQAQIHGNEPSPAEGAMAMLLDMVGTYGEKYLEKVDYICIPRFNVDGANNHIRQTITPSIDMNRDHIRFRALEVRIIHSAYLALMPEVTQDGHEISSYAVSTHAASTTRQPGSTDVGLAINHDIEVTPSTSMNNPSQAVTDQALNVYAKNMFDTMDTLKIYVDHYQGGNPGWTANNGIGRAYYGLMGSVSFLVETRGANAGVNMPRRAYTQMIAAKSLLESLYDNADTTKSLVAKARADIIERGKVYDENKLVYLNQVASGNTTEFRNTGVEIAGSNYSPYKGTARTIDLVGNEMTPTGSSSVNVTKALALNDASDRNRPLPTAYVIPKGIKTTSVTGAVTVTATEDYAINYDHLINSLKWNQIEFYELKAGTSAELRQYYRTDTGDTTNGNIVADLRPAATVTFANGAYVVPLDQVAGAVVVSLFEPDNSNSASFNAAVTQSLAGAEGLALILHDFETRNYPYYRLEKSNPREVLKDADDPDDPKDKWKDKIKDKIDDILDSAGCNAGYGLLILVFAIPLILKNKK